MLVSVMDNEAGGETARNIELPLNEGDVLADKYRIVRPLGKGGFGAVYQVTDSVLNEDVALKIVVTGEGKAGNATEQLLHEFKLRDKIIDVNHVIRAQDPRPCEYKGLSLVLLPMELADGGSMRKWLEQNRDIEKRQEIGINLFKQACLGVKAIHDAGLVHLDLKPENILIVNSRAKIADFGLGRFGAGQFASNPDQLLHQGIGTPEYMSPEQFQVARQKDIKAVSDIYSLGIILFELLDGSRPFDGKPHELKEKHLNVAPPQLAAKLELWGQIVSRCLAKEPQNRYPGIEHLINDLDRAAKGATLSINVSCPKCNHINDNENAKVCQKCRADLDSFFHPCQACGKSVRLDIEICPGCGADVAGYYLLLERKARIALLKDEDPAEAIELLETVLHDGGGEYRQEALELVKDLRKKHSQINELTAQATESMSSGQPEEAIEKWRKILRIIPRHRHAQKNIQEAEALLKDFKRRWKQVPRLMDEANFEKADSLLQECLELIPTQNGIREMLDTCRQRAETYSHAYDQATRLSQQRQMDEAMRELDTALSQAPKSVDAIAMARQLSQTDEEVKKLFRQAQHQLAHAEFDEAQESITMIEDIKLLDRELCDLQMDLATKRDMYTKAMEEAQVAKDDRDLEQAAQRAQRALSACRQSPQAKSLLDQINADQGKARKLLAQVQPLMQAAKFDEAEAILTQVESIWLNAEGLQAEKDALAKCRKEYTDHMESAREFYEKKDLGPATEAAQSAQLICSDSTEALDFIASMQEAKDRAHKHLGDIKKNISAAEFDKAKGLLGQAKQLW
nr:protein kinase [Chloroflexota bacterium]